jgi:3-phosphoshikimate 1-carboxyvinyltransferase
MNNTITNTVTITPLGDKSLVGTIQAAASKSSMQRACAAAFVAGAISFIRNPGHSNDDKAALDIIRRLGANVELTDNLVTVQSSAISIGASPAERREPDSTGLNSEPIEINCGESGLSIRMFTPLAALSNEEIIISGSGSLLTRPMDFFDMVLPQLGVTVHSNNGRLPLKIKGPLRPKTIEIDGSLSSQFLTGLLLAFAAVDASNVSIKVKNLQSKPYIDLTLDVMKQFGLKLPENKNYEEFYFAASATDSRLPPPASQLSSPDYTVEGDWSGGAFLLVAGAIAGPIVVKGLDINSTQADKAIVQALIDSGVGISIESNQVELRPKKMNGFHFNASDCPDLFPPLVALASYCQGKTIIEGVHRLAHKESNRGITLQEEFGKMGIQIDLQDNLMIVHGGTGVQGAKVHSHHDHRIAMACAVAALKATGETKIEEANAVNKSYPEFYEHLKSLGASVSLTDQLINKTTNLH